MLNLTHFTGLFAENEDYNIKQLDFPSNLLRNGICIYVSIYTAYRNLFKNKQQLIDIIKKYGNKLKGSEVIQKINKEIKNNILEYNIVSSSDKIDNYKIKLLDYIRKHTHVPIGYASLDNDSGHMVCTLGADGEYLFYVENAIDNCLYNDTLKFKSINIYEDLVLDKIDREYYKDFIEIINKIQADILNIDNYNADIISIAKHKLTKNIESDWVKTINIDDFFKCFVSYYSVTLAEEFSFSQLSNRLNNLKKIDFTPIKDYEKHRMLVDEYVKKEKERIYNAYVRNKKQ